VRSFAVLALALLASIPAASAAAVDAPPAPADACDVGLAVRRIDATRVALAFWTGGPSRTISGSTALYAGDLRYAVPFRAFARERDGSHGDAVPVVVRFPRPVAIDAAIVTSLDPPARPVCRETLIPWVAPNAAPEDADDTLRAAVAGLPVQDAPPPVMLRHTCPERNASAHAISVARSMVADGAGRKAEVLVTLDPNDQVIATRIVVSTGASHLDVAALDAARRTRYATTVFNCTKLEADYVLTVSF
jgi:TonB family protein